MILCAIRGTGRTLDFALREARQTGSRLSLLFVREQPFMTEQDAKRKWQEDPEASTIFAEAKSKTDADHPPLFCYAVSPSAAETIVDVAATLAPPASSSVRPNATPSSIFSAATSSAKFQTRFPKKSICSFTPDVFFSAGGTALARLEHSTNQSAHMKKIQQLQMLAELERQSQEIRKHLKISRPNEVLYVRRSPGVAVNLTSEFLQMDLYEREADDLKARRV
jgi:hypothetical protein